MVSVAHIFRYLSFCYTDIKRLFRCLHSKNTASTCPTLPKLRVRLAPCKQMTCKIVQELHGVIIFSVAVRRELATVFDNLDYRVSNLVSISIKISTRQYKSD